MLDLGGNAGYFSIKMKQRGAARCVLVDPYREFLRQADFAARQFQRSFVLAEGMEVLAADLKNGLLSIDLVRPQPERIVKSIAINDCDE